MIPQAPSMMLRPLGFGEMLDRAVTLFVKNAALFTGLVLVLVVPIQALNYFIAGDPAKQLAQTLSVFTHPGSVPPGGILAPGQSIEIMAVSLMGLLLAPIIANAVAFGVAQLYRGRNVSVGECLKPAFSRTFPTIGLILLAIVGLLVWYVATSVVVVIPVAVGAVIVKTALPLAIVLFVLGGVLLLAAFAFLAVLLVAIAFSLYALVIESCYFGAALRSGFSRIFTKRELGRALLVALTLFAIELIVLVVFAALAGLLIFVLHLDIVYVILGAIVNALMSAFLYVYVAVYYYDVRVRSEGLDLQMRLNAFAPDAPMP